MIEILGASIAVTIPGETLADSYVVAIQRDDKPDIPYPGRWEAPGGTVEPGESDVDTALREVLEEAGVLVREDQIVWRGLYRSARVPGAYNAFFVAELDELPTLRLGDEGKACRLMPVTEFVSSQEVIVDHADRFCDFAQGLSSQPLRVAPRTSRFHKMFVDLVA